MYKRIIRPVLFLISPERVHGLVVIFIKIFGLIPGAGALLHYLNRSGKMKETEVLGLKFRNRIGLAAGFDKDASFFRQFSWFGFGFIEIGTLTPKPQPGNPKPRSFRLPSDKALINRMGFNNKGVDSAVERLKNRPEGLVVGGNIGKNTLTSNDDAWKDYAYCFEKLYPVVDYFVVNVSCPNITDLRELQDQDMLEGILSHLDGLRSEKELKKPILLKISPDLNFNQIDESLEVVRKCNIDGIVATNTSVGRDMVVSPEEKIEKIGRGGLSGQPIRERSTEIIRYIREKVGPELPIIGVGGIMSVSDAREKLEAGADLVQIYTGFIYEGPGFVKKLIKAL